ncbi:ABC transporter permease [Roseivirga pacifica]|uniref:ABC transporter permease n=1 Tax=Roseivirga pacifica TaxID=1267423 RepID=UPI003BAC8539
MLKHFLKTGYRGFKRQKLYSLVNLLGLAIGMFCFLITALYVKDELTFDRWHENADNIFMSSLEMQREDGKKFNVRPSYALLKALKEESSEVVSAVNISRNNWKYYQLGDEWVQTNQFYYSSPELFEVFDFSLKYGNETTALSEPTDVVISSELAESLFSGENPLDKMISIQGQGELKVVGVLNPIPTNSHLRFDIVASINNPDSRYKDSEGEWVYGTGYNYFLLKEDFNLDNLFDDTKKLLARNSVEDIAAGYDYLKFSDLYLSQQTQRYNNDMFGGQVKYIYIFSLIGTLILLVACFNYINLTTSASISRSKEMGIRKVIGASRASLVSNKMVETLFVSFWSLVLAVIAVEMTLPYINSLIGKSLSFNLLQSPSQLVLPVLLLIIVMVISGIYPAFVLSSINLSTVLRGAQPKTKAGLFKKSLIVFQFIICSGLLIAALAIRSQADFLINMDKGYNEENIMSMSVRQEGQRLEYEVLKNKLESIPQIEVVTSATLPIFPPAPPLEIKVDGRDFAITFLTGYADKNFNEVFQLEFVEGVDFTQVPESELGNAAIINETAKKKLALNPALGAELPNGRKVVGVVSDFFFDSAKSEIQPASIVYSPRNFWEVQFSYRAGNKADVIAQVEMAMKQEFGLKSAPSMTELKTITQGFNFYDTETTLKTIFNILTGMVILVAFLGLFAMATFESNAREKELGIRKVLGANYFHILETLNKHFVGLMIVAFIVSVPTTFYLVEKWLQAFPYRIEGLESFGLSSVAIIVLIAIVILGAHSYLSTRKNPTEVLRNE